MPRHKQVSSHDGHSRARRQWTPARRHRRKQIENTCNAHHMFDIFTLVASDYVQRCNIEMYVKGVGHRVKRYLLSTYTYSDQRTHVHVRMCVHLRRMHVQTHRWVRTHLHVWMCVLMCVHLAIWLKIQSPKLTLTFGMLCSTVSGNDYIIVSYILRHSFMVIVCVRYVKTYWPIKLFISLPEVLSALALLVRQDGDTLVCAKRSQLRWLNKTLYISY